MSKIDNEIKEGTPRFKKGDAFVEIAQHPLVFMEINEVIVSQSYTNETGGNVGGKNGGDVPSLSPACPQLVPSFVTTLVTSLVSRRRKGCKY